MIRPVENIDMMVTNYRLIGKLRLIILPNFRVALGYVIKSC